MVQGKVREFHFQDKSETLNCPGIIIILLLLCVVCRGQESLKKQEADAHGRSVLVQILESMYRFGLGSVAGGTSRYISFFC